MKYTRLFVCAALLAVVVAGASAVLSAAEEGSAAKKLDIVETAMKAGDLKTLVKALQQADLVETLKGEGPFTLFAPNDAAWEKIPEERRETLLNPESEAAKEKLSQTLLNHVTTGKLLAADVAGMETVSTQAGLDVKIEKKEDKIKYGGATIVKTDIECANGVIHVIDAVVQGAPGTM